MQFPGFYSQKINCITREIQPKLQNSSSEHDGNYLVAKELENPHFCVNCVKSTRLITVLIVNVQFWILKSSEYPSNDGRNSLELITLLLVRWIFALRESLQWGPLKSSSHLHWNDCVKSRLLTALRRVRVREKSAAQGTQCSSNLSGNADCGHREAVFEAGGTPADLPRHESWPGSGA